MAVVWGVRWNKDADGWPGEERNAPGVAAGDVVDGVAAVHRHLCHAVDVEHVRVVGGHRDVAVAGAVGSHGVVEIRLRFRAVQTTGYPF